MKLLIATIMLLTTCVSVSFTQNDGDVNVLSYYAVGNSIDGQPLVDKVNVLRFFPVYAFHDSIRSVRITIYYGSNIYSRSADSIDGKNYWEVLLPKFQIGEAIQRVEVEICIGLDTNYYHMLKEMKNKAISFLAFIDSALKTLNKTNNNFNYVNGAFPEIKIAIDSCVSRSQKYSDNIVNIAKSYLDTNHTEIKPLFDSLISTNNKIQNVIKNTDLYAKFKSALAALKDSIIIETFAYEAMLKKSDTLFKNTIYLSDSLKQELFNIIWRDLADTNLTGPSVRRSDIRISKNLDSAQVLYRNYKTSLRRLPALDPAERLGVFRARYVPFVILGKHLILPFNDSAKATFELGLTFGDAIVSGDDFVVPEFSLHRLGVAFVITNRLFSDSAAIRALALTYDFNSYGSIGVGVNFPGDRMESYVSFGINKKAFEDLIGKIQKVFQ